ncbi:HET-domain-containing protein, partial [Glonium stellatum]
MHNLKLPNRVLDLSLLTSNGKVVLSERSTDTSLYACLSHCWGKNRPLVTTSETLAQHKLGISYNKLPKTFQDAITFVCRMSIRYLWIDSLCIIQDDEEDWRRESALMADIYRNAVITLAASAATNSTDGLFSSASAKYLGREVKCLKNCADNHGFYFFQERLLGPRVLHFGDLELLWECTEQSHCECGGRLSMPGSWPSEKKFFHAALLDVLPSRHVSNIWREMVQDYTRMFLTFEKDIFPAISGAAKAMEAATKSRYLAGLWECSIIEDLLWSTSEPGKAQRPSVWRAPTFSWASV